MERDVREEVGERPRVWQGPGDDARRVLIHEQKLDVHEDQPLLRYLTGSGARARSARRISVVQQAVREGHLARTEGILLIYNEIQIWFELRFELKFEFGAF